MQFGSSMRHSLAVQRDVRHRMQFFGIMLACLLLLACGTSTGASTVTDTITQSTTSSDTSARRNALISSKFSGGIRQVEPQRPLEGLSERTRE